MHTNIVFDSTYVFYLGVTDVATGSTAVFRDLTSKIIRKSDNVEVTLLEGVTGRINPVRILV